jgi:hypothetical protein
VVEKKFPIIIIVLYSLLCHSISFGEIIINATILKSKGKIFIINKGNSDGIENKLNFYINRNGVTIGKATVIAVRNKISALKTINLYTNDNIKIGDFIELSKNKSDDISRSNQEIPKSKNHLYLGYGYMSSSNFHKDITNYVNYLGAGVTTPGVWENLMIGYSRRIKHQIHLAFEFGFSACTITGNSGAAIESAKNKSAVMIIQYGLGVRYNFIENKSFKCYLQPSIKQISGSSDETGFPIVTDGMCKELKVGTEFKINDAWIGIEVGKMILPVKPPINQNYINTYDSPTSTKGGDYGGLALTVLCSFWWDTLFKKP